MEDCCLVVKSIFDGFLKAVLLLGFVVIGLVFASPVQAQETLANNPKADYKASLNSLSALYQSQVEKLEKQQQQSKQLYADGLISRVEFENGEKALADVRAKVEEVASEIATANQPAPLITPGFTSVLTGRRATAESTVPFVPTENNTASIRS